MIARFLHRLPTAATLLCVAAVGCAPRADVPPATRPTAITSAVDWQLGPFTRLPDVNPILGPLVESRFDDPIRGRPVAWEHDHVFNPAAIVRGGKVYVLYRAEDDSGEGIGHHTSRLGLATSDDGVHFTREPAPVLYPARDGQEINETPGGCEDPRLIEAPDGTVVLTYTQWDARTPRLAVATSTDLRRWTKHGPAFAGAFADVASKSGAIVCRRDGDRLVATKIAGRYWMYFGEDGMRLATSDDLIHWTVQTDASGEARPLLPARPGRFDSGFAEGGPPAILTERGIVVLYNARNATTADRDPAIPPGQYCGGQALFDATDPARLLARSDAPIFRPESSDEVTGQYAAGTTFLEGLVHFRGRWLLYYGMADTKVGVAGSPRKL